MALTKAQRIAIAREPGAFQQQVTGTILDHAMTLLSQPPGAVDEASQIMATTIVQSPELMTYQFAAAVLIRPEYDDLADPGTIRDEQLAASVAAVWSVMTAPIAASIKPPEVMVMTGTVSIAPQGGGYLINGDPAPPVALGVALDAGDAAVVLQWGENQLVIASVEG
jgi:hypothetical protein